MSNVKFIYVRNAPTPILNQSGEPDRDENGNIRMHKGFPVGCFAYRIISVKKKGIDIGKSCEYGYSVFNPNDKFDKEIARVVAFYRLLIDKRVCYGNVTQHNNDIIANMLYTTACTNIHQWATDHNGNAIMLNTQFQQACIRMSEKLLSKKNEKRDAA